MFTGKKSSPPSKHRRAPSVVQQQPGMQQPPLYDNPLPPQPFGAASAFYDNPAAALQSLPDGGNPYALGAASEGPDVNPYSLADDRGVTGATPPLYDNRPLDARSRSPSAGSLNVEGFYDNRSVGSRTPTPTRNDYLKIGSSLRSSPPPLLPGQATYALASSSDPTQATYALASADQSAYALASSSTDDPTHAVYALATANPATSRRKAQGAQAFYDSGQARENEYDTPPAGFDENLYEDGNRADPDYLAAQRAKENEYHAPPHALSDNLYADGNGENPDYLAAHPAMYGTTGKENLYHETTVDDPDFYATVGNGPSSGVISKQPRATTLHPVAQYPDIECCSGDYQRCFHQHCGCLYLWSRERLSSWWQQQTYMGRSLLQCLFGCFGYNFAPPSAAASLYQEFPAKPKMTSVINPLYGELENGFELETLSVNQLKTTELYRPSRLGCWQTVYAFLGCMGLSRPACIRWIQSHERWETNGRMRFGQLIVDSTCVALVVAVGPTLFFTPVLAAGGSQAATEQSHTGGQDSANNATNTTLTVPTSSLPPTTSMAPGSVTSLPPVTNATTYAVSVASTGSVTQTIASTAIITSSTTTSSPTTATTTTWVSTATSTVQITNTTTITSRGTTGSTSVVVTPSVTTTATPTQAPVISSTLAVTSDATTTIINIPTYAGNMTVTTNATSAINVTMPASVIPTATSALTTPQPTTAPTVLPTVMSTSQSFTVATASTGTTTQTPISPTTTIISSTQATTTMGSSSTTTTTWVTNPTTSSTVQVTSTSTVTPIGTTTSSTVATTPNVSTFTTAVTTTATSSTTVVSTVNTSTAIPTTITSIPTTQGTVTVTSTATTTTVTTPTTTTTVALTTTPTTTTTAPKVLCKDNPNQPCCPGVCHTTPRNPQCLIYC